MRNIFFVSLSSILIFLDWLSKNCALKFLKNASSKKLRLINLSYVENRGAAFGILQNQKIFLSIVTLFATAAIIYFFFCHDSTKSDSQIKLSLALIFSGAIGNFIDRIFRGYVIDFIELSFINFPVFNLADIFLTFGFVVLAIINLSR